jgi:hypothetical protein
MFTKLELQSIVKGIIHTEEDQKTNKQTKKKSQISELRKE